jgi:cellulose synthase operon protein C
MKRLSVFPITLFLLCSGIILPPLGSISTAVAQKASGAVQKGFNLLGKGYVNDAIAAFQQALKQQPQSSQARLGLAIAYRRAGRISEAWNSYQQVLTLDSNNQLALKTVGLLATYRPEWNFKGIDALNTVLQSNANDLEARTLRATLYSYQGKFTEAIADYEIVLNNSPTPDAVIGAAQTYTYSSNFSKALDLFNRYRTTGKPIQGYAAVAYGRTLRETGNGSSAVQVLESQLQRSPGLDQIGILTRGELSQAYLATQQQEKAVAVIEPLKGRPDGILPLARALNEIRKSSNNPNLATQVIDLYQQGLASNPNPSPSLLREVADVFSGLPQGLQKSLQLYRQLASQLPDDKGLQVQQLALENQLGLISKNDLKQRLAGALQPLPSDKAQLQQIAMALTNVEAPDPDLLPIYQNVLQTGVNAPFLNFRVAQMFLRSNDTANARQALAAYTATGQGSKDMASQLLAAEIERREGNLDASAQRFTAILASKQGSSDIENGALRGLAGVKLQQRRLDEALIVYDELIARSPQDINIQLGRTNIAYQAKRISLTEAESVLNNWLATQPATNTPPELYSLVGVLPPDKQREPLYNYLINLDPGNTALQLRLLQVVAQRSPAQAKVRVKQLLANAPQTPSTYRLQAELSQAVGDFDQAGDAYKRILALEPDNVEALSALAGIRFQQQRFGSAQEIYSQVLGYKPEDKEAQRALAGLSAVLDQPLAALSQLEKLQLQNGAQGTTKVEISRQMQQIQEDFLLRRGFQPPWEDYQRRIRN